MAKLFSTTKTATKADMSQLTSAQKDQVRELLQKLVRINSVNENNEQGDRDCSEREMANAVESFLVDLGMEVTRHPMVPGRDNLVAHWPDQNGDKSFAYQAHMDTVGIANMTIDPHGAVIKDGRMWGRGTCDTKGSMASYLTALKIAKEAGWSFVDKVYFVATCAEETGTRGAYALAKCNLEIDAMCVGEPTGCQVVTCHKGTYWTTLRSEGKSCHASMPEKGHNAVYAMSKALRFIEETYVPGLDKLAHPLLGPTTLSVGKIEGGVATNIVPASCVANLDFRILPGQTPEGVNEHFMSQLRQAVADETYSTTDIHDQVPVEISANHPWVKNLITSANPINGQTEPAGVTYYTDAGALSAAGIACIVFGPGSIAHAHTADEYLDLGQLYQATEIALNWLDHAQSKSLVS